MDASCSIEEFVESLSSSGILTKDNLRTILDDSSQEIAGGDARSLGQELVRRGDLTEFQMNELCEQSSQVFVMGEYLILDRIGSGGMGVVYKALHRRMNRDVALKTISTQKNPSDKSLARFKREVRTAAQLNHPNVVSALDAGESNGIHYLVMEYVDGPNLYSLVKQRGPLSVAQTVDCLIQAARGLEYAHQQGIIHRDIKPSNLLVDKSGVVKILDMGLALFAVDESGKLSGELTHAGQILGTFDYMAPEQASDSRRADERSDVYSLGCTLYHLLTGKNLYGGSSGAEKLIAHRERPIPSLEEAREDVPKELNELFRRMVAKRSEDRISSMAEVVKQLVAIKQALDKTYRSDQASDSQLTEYHSNALIADSAPVTPVADERTVSSQGELQKPAEAGNHRSRQFVILASLLVGAAVLIAAAIFVPPYFAASGEGESRRNQDERLAAGKTPPPVQPDKKLSPVLATTDAPKNAPFAFAKEEAIRLQNNWAEHLQSPVFFTNSIEMKFALIPPCEDREPGSPFYLGVSEVSQKQFQKVMQINPSAHAKGGARQDLVANVNTDKLPVENLTLAEAKEFCVRLTELESDSGRVYRLPSRQEWKFASRAGSSQSYSFGQDHTRLHNYTWFAENSENRTHDTDTKLPNAFGLFNMLGNVHEWTSSQFGSSQVICGGSFDSAWEHCWAARDTQVPKMMRANNCGFRVVCTLKKSDAD